MYHTKKWVHLSLGTQDKQFAQQQACKRLMEFVTRELKDKLEQIKSQIKTIRELTQSYTNELYLIVILVDIKNQNTPHKPENRGKQSWSKD